MSNKGLGVRSANDAVKERSLHFVELFSLHVAANSRNDARALFEGGLNFGVHNEVDVTLAIAQFLIRQTMELLRKRTE